MGKDLIASITIGFLAACFFFIITFINHPTGEPFRITGQLLGSVGVGAVVFIVSWFIIGALFWIRKRIK